MYAYKGFHKNLTCTMGKETYQYEVNKWYEEKEANCVKNGFHCCENPLDCLAYYPLNGDNRFFLVEAAGDINEDGEDKISCTRIRLLKELTPVDIAVHAARYMFRHPAREWHHDVCKEYGFAKLTPFVIVRGKNPAAAGTKGSSLVLLKEYAHTRGIQAMNVITVDGEKYKAGTTYNIDGRVVDRE